MVPDYAAQAGGIRRFHGYSFDASLGPKVEVRDELGRKTGEVRNHGAFVKKLGAATDDVIVISSADPNRSEYIRHLRDRDLWPADEYTAQMVGQKFDPTFGGEHSDEAKASQKLALDEARAVSAQPLPSQPAPMSAPKAAMKG